MSCKLHEVDQFLDDAPVRDLVAQRPDPIEQRRQRTGPHMDVRPSKMFSSTVMPRNSARFWNVRATPRVAMRCGFIRVMSSPNTTTQPPCADRSR